MNKKIVIVTPTFNRCKLLARLYRSLKNQTEKAFTWLIIDDGSTDNTEKYILSLYDKDIKIIYTKIENGGKCKALNYAFQNFNDYMLYVIVDSDDYLYPNAIQTILQNIELYKHKRNIGGIFFRYINKKNNKIIIGKKDYSSQSIITSRLQHDDYYGKYDGCISYFNRAIEKYRYPEFENENYMGPIVLQILMNQEFKIVFTKYIVGIAEYQKGGISNLGRKLRLLNPLGMIVYCGLMQQSLNVNTRIKYAIMAQAYRFYTKESKSNLCRKDILEKYFPKYAVPGGYILAAYWKMKYRY